MDYRLILLGSMLPDIMDKPLGTWLLQDTLSNGRVFGHTLLLSLLLVALGACRHPRTRTLRWVAFGSLAHLALDKMWLNPGTLFWPLYGWGFEKTDIGNWLEKAIGSLGTEPGVFIPEGIGALFLGAFFLSLLRRGKLLTFLRTGAAH